MAVNEEIYTYKELKESLRKPYEFSSDSDVKFLSPCTWSRMDFVNKLDGMFAFVLYDRKAGSFIAGRDHMGIIPLYCWRADGGVMYSSVKALKTIAFGSNALNPAAFTSRRHPVLLNGTSRHGKRDQAGRLATRSSLQTRTILSCARRLKNLLQNDSCRM